MNTKHAGMLRDRRAALYQAAQAAWWLRNSVALLRRRERELVDAGIDEPPLRAGDARIALAASVIGQAPARLDAPAEKILAEAMETRE